MMASSADIGPDTSTRIQNVIGSQGADDISLDGGYTVFQMAKAVTTTTNGGNWQRDLGSAQASAVTDEELSTL